MSDLKAIPLEDASPEERQQLAAIIAQAKAAEQLNASGHKCYLYIPTAKEWEQIKPYSNNCKCPKCGHRLVLRLDYTCSLTGQAISVACLGCEFKIPIDAEW